MKKMIIRIILKLDRMHLICLSDKACLKLKYYLMVGNKIDFKESIWTLNNQILKASRFEFLLRKKEA